MHVRARNSQQPPRRRAAAAPPRLQAAAGACRGRARRGAAAGAAQRTLVFVSLFAPRSTSSCTTPKWPVNAAHVSGTQPSCARRAARDA